MNTIENLENIIESLLFVAGNSVSKGEIMEKIQVLPEELEDAIILLKEKYSGECGIKLIEVNDKLQLSANSKYANEVALVLNPIRERALSKSTLETVSIIAYKQPVTRLDVENIRGLNSDYAMQVLLKHGLIEVVGRKDTIGKPLLFGTTEEFLKRFELSSLSSLPNYDDLMAEIQTIYEETSALYTQHDVSDEKIESVENLEEVLTTSLEAEKYESPSAEVYNEEVSTSDNLEANSDSSEDNLISYSTKNEN